MHPMHLFMGSIIAIYVLMIESKKPSMKADLVISHIFAVFRLYRIRRNIGEE